MSVYEAMLMKLMAKALEGHGPSLRHFLKLTDQATSKFYAMNQHNMEIYRMLNEHIRSKLGRRSKGSAELLNRLSQAIKKALKE